MARDINHRFWTTHRPDQLAALDRLQTVVIVPVAAIEQHGPHLPFGVDRILGQGLLVEMFRRLGAEVPAIAVPQIAVGKSDEHEGFPGTLSLDAETLIAALADIGASIARSEFRKVLFLSSHGGNGEAIGIVTRRLRLEHDMLAVAGHWPRFGLPSGLFGDDEMRHGIHAGDIETSMMLHLRPDLVDMNAAKHFESLGEKLAAENRWLGSGGPFPFGWRTEDLNSDGAVGNARLATAEKGRLAIEHQVEACAQLIREISAFDLGRIWS